LELAAAKFMEDFLQTEIFNVQEWTLMLYQLIYFGLLAVGFTFLLVLIMRFGGRKLAEKGWKDWKNRRNVRNGLILGWILSLIWGFIVIFELNLTLYPSETLNITIGTLIQAAIIIIFAQILDKVLNKILYDRYIENQMLDRFDRAPVGLKKKPEAANRLVQNVVIMMVAIILIEAFGLDFKMFEIPTGERSPDLSFSFSNIFTILFIFFTARLMSWVLTQFVLVGYYRSRELNQGLQYAINQILTYFIYVIAIFILIEALGIQFTVLLGGLAALLVGIGLGLQQTFNDLISGIILLFERSIEVGDVIEFDNMVGAVERIGIRTSLIESRDNIMIVIPNSHLITRKVINWSHLDDKARFRIEVGVAYGSDTELVKNLLLEAAREHELVLAEPSSTVQFRNFGNSSLDFLLFFWSKEYLPIEGIKSDIRYAIDQKFRKHGVTIPFPQRDLWIKNPDDLRGQSPDEPASP
jgi:small-conductance mechanosensitive channel